MGKGKKKSKKKAMTRTRPPKNPHGAGRTGVFQPWMIQEAQELVGKLGARNSDLAEYFDVHVTTVEYWLRHKPEFKRAVKKGRLESSLKVSQALYHKAIGYSHPDTKYFMQPKKYFDEDGKLTEETKEPLAIRITKYYPPDTAAAIKYLSIMMREVWAENTTLSHLHKHSGSVDIKKVEELSMDSLTEEMRELLFNINIKQLSSGQEN